eukprot:29899_1
MDVTELVLLRPRRINVELLIYGYSRIHIVLNIPNEINEIIMQYFFSFFIIDTLQEHIYKGFDVVTNSECIIKEESNEKQRNIIMTLTNLPNCPSALLHGIDAWNDTHYYFATEFYDIKFDLFDYIQKTHSSTNFRQFVRNQSLKKQKPLQTVSQWLKDVSRMFAQICEAIQWLHINSICHLDISLESINISQWKPYIQLKITDFSRAKKIENNNYKMTGRIGKLGYMAPETYGGDMFDGRAADVYCLGPTLFMMLIGSPPYKKPALTDAAFNFIINGRIGDVLKHWKRMTLITVDALDLLTKIFRPEPSRITLPEILKHPFITKYSSNST